MESFFIVSLTIFCENKLLSIIKTIKIKVKICFQNEEDKLFEKWLSNLI